MTRDMKLLAAIIINLIAMQTFAFFSIHIESFLFS